MPTIRCVPYFASQRLDQLASLGVADALQEFDSGDATSHDSSNDLDVYII